MNSTRHLIACVAFALALGSAAAADAAGSTKAAPVAPAAAAKGKLIPAKDADPAWVAKARKNYPLTTCLSSDEKFGDPADIAAFVYREPGKSDRLVLFCCEGCGDDFLKETDKDLAKLDAAEKKRAAGARKKS
jgi:hypothetical protein